MKKSKKKILVIGRAGLDLYADPVNTPIEDATNFVSQLGGSAANIAAGLAKQGNAVDLFSPISDDPIGNFVINSCKHIGINTELLIKVSNSKNTLAIVDSMGEKTKAVLYRDNPADLYLNESYLEKVDLDFTKDGIETIAKLATEINSTIENIGARRLYTIIEKVLDDISFTATDRSGEKIIVDENYVTKNLGELAKDTDLSKFIL